MKVYTVKVEERPFAKAFFQVAEIISDALEHADGDDIVTVTPEMPNVQEKPEPTPSDTLSAMMKMLKKHSYLETQDIVRSLNAYYNRG